MKDELILSGKKYISSRRAASSTSYSQDYLGQLIRAKKIDAMMVGRSWFILEESLASYVRSLEVTEPTQQVEASSAEDKKIFDQSAISDTRAPEIPASSQASTLRYFADDAPLIPELKKEARLDSGVIEESRPTFKEISRAVNENSHSPSPFELIPGHSISSIVRHTVVTALLVTSVVGGSLLIDGESAPHVTSASSSVDVMSRSIDILSDAYLEGIEQSGAQMASGVESFIRVGDSVIDLYDHGVQTISSAVGSAVELVSAVVDDPALATSHIRSGLSEKGFWIHAPSQISAVIASQPARDFSVAERIALGVYKTFSPLVDTSKELFASLFGDDRQDAETVVVDSDDSQAVRLALEKFNQSEQAGLIVATSSLSDESVSSISTSTDTRSEVQAISSVPSVTTIAEVSSDSQVVETVRIVSSGITSADVSRQISQAVAQLEGQIRDLRSSNSVNRQNTRSVFESIDLGNIRDANVIDANITGSTFSGPKVTTDSLNTTGTGVNAILGPTYFDTDTLVIDSVNRRVGIGTTSPYAKLSVVGETVSTYFTATSTTATSSFMGGLTLGTDGLVYQQATKNVGIGTTSPNATLSILQSANGTPIIDAYRITDTAPTGDFINYRSRAGTSLFRVDNSGNLSAGGIINTGSQTITSVSGPQFRVQYDGSNEITTSVSSSGTTTIAVSGATPALVFTPQTDRVTSFQFTNAAALPVLSIDTQNQRVGVGTTSPSRMFSVGGNAFVGGNLLVQPTGNGPQLTVNANGSGNDTEFVLGDGLGAFWNISRENSIGNPNLGDLTFESSVAGTVLSLENSGFVGIGTTSPLGRLSIEQDTETASFVVGNTGSTTVYGAASPSLFVGGVNRDGRIGMGTAAPNARLEIYNTSPASGPNEVLRLSNGFVTGALNEVQMKFDNGLGTHDWSIGARPVGPGYFRISQSGSEYLRIDSSGKIGIGTTSPWGKLSINYSTSDVAGQPIFVIASSTASATTTQFIVTNSGNVGIGTSTPTQILTVARDTSADTNVKVMNTLNMLDFGVDTTSAFIQARRSFSAAATPLSFYVGNTEAIRIASSTGNVGIGSTSPAVLLTLASTTANSAFFEAMRVSNSNAAGSGGYIFFERPGDPTRGLVIGEQYSSDDNLNRPHVRSAGGSSEELSLRTGFGTSGRQGRLFLTSSNLSATGNTSGSGQLGIGSTSPAANLSVAGTAGGSGPIVLVSSSTAGFATSTVFVVDSSGRVGVDAASPRVKVEIGGPIAAPTALSSAVAVTSGNLLLSNSNNYTVGSVLGIAQNGSSYDTYIQSRGLGASNTAYNILLNPLGGNVGIGSFSPTTRLEITGSVAQTTIGVEELFKMSRLNNDGLSFPQAASFALGSYAVNSSGNGYGPSSRLDLRLKSTQSDNVTTDLTAMTWLGNGNVGIGSTSPAAKLSVAGTAGGSGPIVLVSSSTAGFATSTAFIIDANGNVGLGTTNLLSRLSLDSGNNLGSPTRAQVSLGLNSLNNYAHFIASIHNNTPIGNAIRFYTNDGTLNGVFPTNAIFGLSVSNGRIGVGIDPTQGKLHLSGGDGLDTFTNPTIALGFSSTATFAHYIHTRHNSASIGNAIDFYTSDGTSNGTFPTNAIHGLSIVNGSVGIGTTSPLARLSVAGDTYVGGNLTATGTVSLATTTVSVSSSIASGYVFRAEYTGSNNRGIAIGGNGADALIQSYAPSLGVSGAGQPLRINANGGNVGVGVTGSVRAPLEVRGSIYQTWFGGTQFLGTLFDSSYQMGTYVDADNRTMTIVNRDGDGVTTRPSIQFMTGTGSTTRMTIRADGNVGIGTTNPYSALQVNSSTSTGIVAGFYAANMNLAGQEALIHVGGSGTSGNYGVMFGATPTVSTPSVQQHAFIVKTNTGEDINHVERFRITSTGNVGIGTTTPSNLLDVQGSSPTIRVIGTGAGGTQSTLAIEGLSGNVGNRLLFRRGQASATIQDRWQFLVNGSENSIDNGAGSDFYIQGQVNNGGWADRFTIIRNTGNVGIGTTSPSAKLSVSSFGGSQPQFVVASSTGSGATSTDFIVTSNGNVGIGTTSPLFTLGINGGLSTNARSLIGTTTNFLGSAPTHATLKTVSVLSSRSDSMPLSYQGSAGFLLATDPTNDSLMWNFVKTSGNQDLLIAGHSGGVVSNVFFANRANGFVGIGDTNPTNRLQVAGTLSAQNIVATSTIATSTFAGGITGPNNFIIQQSSGNVGIGTTSPFEKLSVTGNSVVTGNSYIGTYLAIGSPATDANYVIDAYRNNNSNTVIRAYNPNSGSSASARFILGNDNSPNNGQIIQSSSGETAFGGPNSLNIYQSTNAPIAFFTSGGSERMRITGTGNVGIGTTTPRSALHVVSSSGTNTNTIFDGTNGAGPSVYFGNAGALFASVGAAQATISGNNNDLGISADNNIYFESGAGGARMILNSSGNLGIGTTTPQALLHTSRGNDASIQFLANRTQGSTGAFGIDFSSGFTRLGSQNDVRIFTGASNIGDLASASERLTILSSNGNVGIGTTSPNDLLQIYNASGQGVVGIDSVAGQNSVLNFRGANALKWQIYNQASDDSLIVRGNSANVVSVLSSGAVANTLVLRQGNVGIGTTTPLGPLDVYGTSAVTSVYSSGSQGADFRAQAGSRASESSLGLFQNQSGYRTFGNYFVTRANTSDLSLVKRTNNADTEVLTVSNASGNVGIGTTSPFVRLSVGGGDFALDANQKLIIGGYLGQSYITYRTPGASPGMDFYVGGQYAMTIDGSTRRLGIGTTTPYAALSVVGEAVARNFTATSTTATSTFAGGFDVGGGALRYDFSSGVTTIDNLEIGNTFFESDAGIITWADLPVTSASAAGVINSYTASINGNPLLTLYSTSDGLGSVSTLSVGIGTTTPTGTLNVASTSPSIVITDTNAGLNAKHWLLSNFDGSFRIGTSTDALNATSTYFVVTTGGNVGIGTTSPQRLLHVYRNSDGPPVRFEDSNGYCEIDPTSATWSCTSDASLKKDVSSLVASSTLERIAHLNSVSFRWNRQDESEPLSYGFIAQEVEAVFPELVRTDSVTGLKTVLYGGFTPFIVESVQALKMSIDDLTSRMTSAESRIAALEAQVAGLGVGSGTTTMYVTATTSTSTVAGMAGEWLSSLGAVFESGIARFASIVTQSLSAQTITVRNDANPSATGITIYDRITNEPVCVYVAQGIVRSEFGACGSTPTVTSDGSSDNTPTPESPAPTTPDPSSGDTSSTTPDTGGDVGTTTPDMTGGSAPEPTPEPTPEPSPTSEPTPEPTPEPTLESVPEPTV